MKIALVTTQSLAGSTMIGRALPLAEELAKKHKVHVLVHKFPPPLEGGGGSASRDRVVVHSVGRDPFTKTPHGKKRLSGIALIVRLKWNALAAALKLIALKPDAIIIVKSLPENVFAAWLAARLIRPKKIILDVDDFELTANVTSSWLQRAAIHWAERTGAKLAHHITAATPFLADHFEQLTQGKKEITLIPTGLSPLYTSEVYKGHSLQPTHYNLVYAGSLTLSSGHRIDLLPDILSEVRKEYPEIQLHIYGDGDDVEKLKSMFAGKNLTSAVVWHGRFVQQHLVSELCPEPQPAGGNKFFVSRPFRAERGMGTEGAKRTKNFVTERRLDTSTILLDPIDNHIINRAKSSFRVSLAALLGLPVVSSDIGIRPYLLPDSLHPRCFAKPGDTQDYAQKIMGFLHQPLTSAEQISLREHGQKFTWLQLAQKYEKILAA